MPPRAAVDRLLPIYVAVVFADNYRCGITRRRRLRPNWRYAAALNKRQRCGHKSGAKNKAQAAHCGCGRHIMPLQPTANSAAFIREARRLDALNARRLNRALGAIQLIQPILF
jgi:hypothetical protein